jgi:plasmid stabilization system protein ParE
MMRVDITAEAEADLAAIGAYIAAESPFRAARLLLEIQEACHAIGLVPLASPLAEGLESQGIRRKVYRRYLIFYRIKADVVEIAHVIHGARDYMAILSSEP